MRKVIGSILALRDIAGTIKRGIMNVRPWCATKRGGQSERLGKRRTKRGKE